MSTVISLCISVLSIVAMWMIFQKAGLEGWKAIIPIYNCYCLFKITWKNGWFFLLMLIPIVNIVIWIMTMHKLSKSFGKGTGFTVGLVLLSIIFMCILAFGSDTYQELN